VDAISQMSTTLLRSAENEASIYVGSRRLRLVGTHSNYMRGLRRWRGLRTWRADKTAIAAAAMTLSRGSLCLDVGAHIGLTAITVAVLRPDCRVVAFEPQPMAQECLRQNLAANAITNVEVIDAAVADFSGPLSFSDNGPWSVANRGTVACKAVRLDDLGLGAPNFIKIDVEGFEPNVLAGARRLIAEAQPLVFMEFCPWTLLLHHYDPLTFATSIWSNFDVLQVFHRERAQPLPHDPQTFLHVNLMRHECVSDLLLRPRAPIPPLEQMVHHRTSN
jgi:FkbM family methyltransferase